MILLMINKDKHYFVKFTFLTNYLTKAGFQMVFYFDDCIDKLQFKSIRKEALEACTCE